jgi:hypothetical protein
VVLGLPLITRLAAALDDWPMLLGGTNYVTLSNNVTPLSMVVNNTNLNYTIASAAGTTNRIQGTNGLLKAGSVPQRSRLTRNKGLDIFRNEACQNCQFTYN